jgi:hypothetical protein
VLIALGFWSRITPFRLYGLVVTIVCVLKLVTLDIVDADALMRVVAFIVGGMICFGVSALYNFAVKRFGEIASPDHDAVEAATAFVPFAESPAPDHGGAAASPGQIWPSAPELRPDQPWPDATATRPGQIQTAAPETRPDQAWPDQARPGGGGARGDHML